MSGVAGQNRLGFAVPVFVLSQQDGPPAHLTTFEPLPIRRHDCVRDFFSGDHLLGQGRVVGQGLAAGLSIMATTWTSRVTNRAVTTEPSPPAIGGQLSMAVTKASPETSSSGRFSGSIRPAQRPISNIHERGRMISASTMPPSLRSTVMDTLAQVAWFLCLLACQIDGWHVTTSPSGLRKQRRFAS